MGVLFRACIFMSVIRKYTTILDKNCMLIGLIAYLYSILL